jgi:hypothetical protein
MFQANTRTIKDMAFTKVIQMQAAGFIEVSWNPLLEALADPSVDRCLEPFVDKKGPIWVKIMGTVLLESEKLDKETGHMVIEEFEHHINIPPVKIDPEEPCVLRIPAF